MSENSPQLPPHPIGTGCQYVESCGCPSTQSTPGVSEHSETFFYFYVRLKSVFFITQNLFLCMKPLQDSSIQLSSCPSKSNVVRSLNMLINLTNSNMEFILFSLNMDLSTRVALTSQKRVSKFTTALRHSPWTSSALNWLSRPGPPALEITLPSSIWSLLACDPWGLLLHHGELLLVLGYHGLALLPRKHLLCPVHLPYSPLLVGTVVISYPPIENQVPGSSSSPKCQYSTLRI